MGNVQYREARADDAAAIACLHADSWRRHYRGASLDSYLDGDVVADRMAEWTGRLSRTAPDRYTLVADLDGGVVGFAYNRNLKLLPGSGCLPGQPACAARPQAAGCRGPAAGRDSASGLAA